MRAAEIIQDMGPSTLVIKRGEYGAALFTPTGSFLAPAFPVRNVVDPTGAGDSFAGAMIGFLAEMGARRQMITKDPAKWDLLMRRAVLAGTVMASFTVEDFSVHRLIRLANEELVSRQNAFMRMISLDPKYN